MALFFITCKFFYFFLQLSSSVVPRCKFIFFKLRSIINMSNSVPACRCRNWDAEQVLILENQFCHIIKETLKNDVYAVKRIHITCSYAVMCFILHIIFIRCLTLHNVIFTAGPAMHITSCNIKWLFSYLP